MILNLLHLLSEMLPYFILILTILTLIMYRKYVVNKGLIDLIIILFFTIFAGIKVPFTSDLHTYVSLYKSADLNLFYFEPMFIFIKKIGHFFNFNYYFLFIVYQFLTISFIVYGIKLFSKNDNFFFGFSLFIYICIPFLFLSSYGVEIRQLLALSIMFVAFYYLFNFSYKKFFFLSLIAFFAHYSSIIIFIVIVFIFYFFKKINKIKVFILLILNIIIFLLVLIYPNIFDSIIKLIFSKLFMHTKYSNYLIVIDRVSILKLLIYNLMSICVLFLLYNKFNFIKHKKEIYYSIIFFSIGTIFLDILNLHNSSTRILYYFFILQIIFVPYIVKLFKEKSLIAEVIILFYLIQFIYGLTYISPFGNRVFLPYKGFYVSIFDIKVKETY